MIGFFILIGVFFLFFIIANRYPLLWCKIGLHHWEFPGGTCMDCKIKDNFFETH